jgi:hypothetical protein
MSSRSLVTPFLIKEVLSRQTRNTEISLSRVRLLCKGVTELVKVHELVGN